jgi:hypothetical protein
MVVLNFDVINNMRTDKKISIAKVAKEVLNNPLLNQREIADKTWLSLGNVNDKLNILEQEGQKDDRIIWLTDKDFELMKQIQNVKFKRLQEDEQINNNDLDKWENTAVKRYSLFRWSATDEQWGLKETVTIEI